ncbi:MAG: SpoIIE family protein phosphatase [Chitinispirillaceae bacterium]
MQINVLDLFTLSEIILLFAAGTAISLLWVLYRRFPFHLIYKSKVGLETMLDAVADPLAVIDENFTIIRANRAYIQLVKRSFQASIGRKCYKLLRNRSTVCEDCKLMAVLQSGNSQNTERSPHPSGEGALSFVFSPYTFTSDNKSQICVIEHIRDITTLEQLKNDLERKNRSLAKTTKKLKSAQLSIKSELKLARQIQQGLLPSSTPEINGLKLDVIYQPVADVGGDVYDFFFIDNNKLGIFIGDASGHGFSSALVGTLSKMSLYYHSQSPIPASELLTRMNHDLLNNIHTSHYLTCFWCIIDLEKNSAVYSRAGHPIPLVMRNGKLLNLSGDGPFLGIIEDAVFDQRKFQFEPNDRLFLFTDGIYDVVNRKDDSILGYDQFLNILTSTSDIQFENVIATVKKQLNDYSYEDDYTLIIAQVNGSKQRKSISEKQSELAQHS